jgi:hypothetical protein
MSLHKRLKLLGLTTLVAWLMWATPVSWAACTAMSVNMLRTDCPHQTGDSQSSQDMTEGCLLQLGGFTNYLAVQPISVHVPAPALPPASLESLLRKPQVSTLAPLVDVSPPLRPRPLRLYYAVFLK